MSMKLEICPESGFLRVVTMGEFSLEEAKRTFLEILEAVVRCKVEKVLFDGRRIVGEPKTIERFYYGEFVAQAVWRFADRGVSPGTQFAYVLEEPVLDPRKFGETVAVNRGMSVKTFNYVDDALRWLGMAPANKQEAGDS
jgi:hypothetical protein